MPFSALIQIILCQGGEGTFGDHIHSLVVGMEGSVCHVFLHILPGNARSVVINGVFSDGGVIGYVIGIALVGGNAVADEGDPLALQRLGKA